VDPYNSDVPGHVRATMLNYYGVTSDDLATVEWKHFAVSLRKVGEVMMIAIVYLFRFGGVWWALFDPARLCIEQWTSSYSGTPSISGGKCKRGRGKRRIFQDIDE
jgi:hypothetical protein